MTAPEQAVPGPERRNERRNERGTERRTEPRAEPGGVGFWIGVAAGAALLAVGVRYALDAAPLTHPWDLARWLAGVLVVHDGIVFPLTVLAGLALGRLLPRWAAGPVRGAAALSVLLTVFAWPLVRRFGERPTVPSALPGDYGRNLLIVLGTVWAWAGLAAAARWRGQRRLR